MAAKKNGKSKTMRARRTPKVTRTDSPTASKARKPLVVELGCAGHFICSSYCRFRRHTQIGGLYRVSTVGDLYFNKDRHRQTVGSGDKDFYETYVFETTGEPVRGNDGCGCIEVKSFGEIDGARWETAGAAQAGHDRFVAKYVAIARRDGA